MRNEKLLMSVRAVYSFKRIETTILRVEQKYSAFLVSGLPDVFSILSSFAQA